MKCEQALQMALEGRDEYEVRLHQQTCAACRQALAEHAQLSGLLDEWQPEIEPSGSFDARLRARIAMAEAERAQRPWARLIAWWEALSHSLSSQPVAAAVLLILLLVGGGVLLRQRMVHHGDAQTAPAVARDLQTLDRDSELVESFDLLSEQPTPRAPAGAAATQNQ